MMTFKQFLKEELSISKKNIRGHWTNISKLDVYLNPTVKELNKLAKENEGEMRGWIDNNGDTYVWKADYIHYEILDIIKEDIPTLKGIYGKQIDLVTINRHTLKKGLCIHIKNTNQVYLNESSHGGDQELIDNNTDIREYIQNIYDKSKKKNRLLKYHMNIVEFVW